VSTATASVAKGGTQQFSAAVATQGDAAETVTWSVTGTANSGTGIGSTSGLLTVAATETAATLKVIATATFDNTKADTAIVTVTGGSNDDDDDDGGDDDDDPATDDNPSTAVETLRATSLPAYPTPTSGIFYIDNPDGDKVEVYNVLGVLVETRHAASLQSSGSATLDETLRATSLQGSGSATNDISHLPAGVYIIRVEGKTAKVVKR
jgi:hypothetical protein